MARTVSDVDVLHDYLVGVMNRADHHAGDVGDICLAIAGAVVWRKDGDIQVFEREGNMANALWVSIDEKRYAISYNHDELTVEIRENNLKGRTLGSFDNSNTVQDVREFFEAL